MEESLEKPLSKFLDRPLKKFMEQIPEGNSEYISGGIPKSVPGGILQITLRGIPARFSGSNSRRFFLTFGVNLEGSQEKSRWKNVKRFLEQSLKKILTILLKKSLKQFPKNT